MMPNIPQQTLVFIALEQALPLPQWEAVRRFQFYLYGYRCLSGGESLSCGHNHLWQFSQFCGEMQGLAKKVPATDIAMTLHFFGTHPSLMGKQP